MYTNALLFLLNAFAYLNREVIGSTNYSHKSSRIENGYPTAPDQFPFQVIINATDTIEILDNLTVSSHICSGTILSERWILTSAICLPWGPGMQRDLLLELGGQHLMGDGIRYDIEKFVVHPEFNGTINQNNHNIALIQTNRTIEFSKQIQPVGLSALKIGETYAAQFTGWEWARDGRVISLKYTNVITISNDDCRLFLEDYLQQFVVDNILCVNNADLQGATFQDTGGALISIEDGKVIGVLSFILGDHFQEGYMRVAPYIEWISNVTESVY